MLNLIYVGLGGFIGACLRYIITVSSSRFFGDQMPYGTLIVNVMGGIFIGLIMEFSVSSEAFSPGMRLFLTTGIMGGLTTFSTFSYETISLFNNGNYIFGFLNICLNLVLSFGGVIFGRYASNII